MRGVTRALWWAVLVVATATVFPTPPSGAAGGDDVEIRTGQFLPQELTVEVGTEVTWTNKDDGQVHSVTADDGSFDSHPTCSDANPAGCMDSREQFTHQFSAEGRFPYHSRTHGGAGGQGTSGVVIVVASATATP